MLNINNSNDRYELFVKGDSNDADYINHTATKKIDKMPEAVYIELARALYKLSKNSHEYSIREDFMLADDEIVNIEIIEKYAPKLKEYDDIITSYYGWCDYSLEKCLYYIYEEYIPIDSGWGEYVHSIEEVELYKIQDKIAYQYDFEADEWKKKLQFFD